MIKWLIKILFGNFCKHDWTIIGNVEYFDCYRMLLKCNKCGCLKKEIY